jgi:hypothetical protein
VERGAWFQFPEATLVRTQPTVSARKSKASLIAKLNARKSCGLELRGVMTSNKRISLIAIQRFLATFLIMLSALSVTAIAENPVPLINQPLMPDAIAPGGAGSRSQSMARALSQARL